MDKIEQFFNAYISGSYERFRKFRECSAFSIDTRTFDNDTEFTGWLAKEKHPFNTPDQKLKAIWDYTEQLNALHLWMNKKVKSDIQNGIAVSYDPNSRYVRQSLIEFNKEVATGAIAGAMSYKIEAISPKDFYIYVFTSTNADFPIMNFQNYIIQGMQSKGYDIFHYNHSPQNIIASKGDCIYAVLTGSVLVNTWSCYVPIAVEFYWSPADDNWLPLRMGRYSMGVYDVLF